MMKQHLVMALPALVHPIAVLCVRYGVKLNELLEVFKHSLVLAAEGELQREGESVSVSRLSIMTGVHRPDVTRLLASRDVTIPQSDLLAKVVWKWQQEREYLTPAGTPRVLGVEGSESEFALLVRSVSTALNPYTVLFELERSGHIERGPHGATLLQEAFVPLEDIDSGLRYLAADLEDLMFAVEENLLSDEHDTRNHHLTTEYDNIPVEAKGEIQERLLLAGNRIHRRIRRYLGTLDRGSQRHARESLRVVFGSFARTEIRTQERS